jgi:hypothetical protein
LIPTPPRPTPTNTHNTATILIQLYLHASCRVTFIASQNLHLRPLFVSLSPPLPPLIIRITFTFPLADNLCSHHTLHLRYFPKNPKNKTKLPLGSCS